MAASLYYMITGQAPKNLRPGVDPWMILITRCSSFLGMDLKQM